ncbi:MAG TPA: response regulator [Candidatus Binatia bacterium]|jgi:CheY-like chemotaxis protein
MALPHRHSVLLIDDDVTASEPLEELLQLEGIDVVLAGDGAEAHAHLRGGARPCVIVLDLRMPGMDGYEFREEQLRDPALARIPVIVMSGDGLVDERSLELGIDEYLRKPIDVDQFITAIESRCSR